MKRARRRRRAVGRIVGGMLAVGFALTVSVPAWAASGAATLAPLESGSYVLTVTNTGPEALMGFVFTVGENPTDIVPSPACKFGNTPVSESINCTIALAPGASAKVCYTGHAVAEALPGSPATVLLLSPPQPYISAVTIAPVSACPVSGFKAASGSTGSTGGGSKCLVPNVKGKTLAAAEKAISKAHCSVGKRGIPPPRNEEPGSRLHRLLYH